MGAMNARYLRLPSRALDREVHLWTYGAWGAPVLVFPTASGMAHEWEAAGAIEALRPLIDAGRIKLYCPESNVSEAWTGSGPPDWRLERHLAYERFIVHELVPWIRQDCGSPTVRIAAAGASFGAYYAANMALKAPEIFHRALCLSGRYAADRFLDGYTSPGTWFVHPLAYVPGLQGEELAAVQRQTHITLVVGRGAHEGRCVEETHALADALEERRISHERDVWGHDVSHEWRWWRRQLQHHLGRWCEGDALARQALR